MTHINGSQFVLWNSADLEPWIFYRLMMLVPEVPLDSISLKNRSGKYLIYYQRCLKEGIASPYCLPTLCLCVAPGMTLTGTLTTTQVEMWGREDPSPALLDQPSTGPPAPYQATMLCLPLSEKAGWRRPGVKCCPLSALKCLFLLAEGGLQSSQAQYCAFGL